MSGSRVTVRRCGEHAVLLEVDAGEVPATYRALRSLLDGATWSALEVVPAATTVLVEGLRGPLDELVQELERRGGDSATTPGAAVVEVPTVYDGEDLVDVARLWDMSTDEVVATHQATDFTVAFCGFAPGFAYCTGLPERLHVPRRRRPRTRVPAGSVALAGEFTGVYPSESPGGWLLLGRTDLTLWDSGDERPATLAPGARVRFVQVER